MSGRLDSSAALPTGPIQWEAEWASGHESCAGPFGGKKKYEGRTESHEQQFFVK